MAKRRSRRGLERVQIVTGRARTRCARAVSAPAGGRARFARSVPEDNPLTRDVVALGERLFFDPALSANGAVSCASCHRPERAFSDSVAVSRGVFGRIGRRNAPTLVNRAYGRTFFWDGRVATLEEQVLHPIQDSVEMGQPFAALTERLRRNGPRNFAAPSAESRSIRLPWLARSPVSCARSVQETRRPIGGATATSPALSPEAQRGFALFTGRANCVACHVGPNLSDEQFHNTGVSTRVGDGHGASDPVVAPA